MANKQIEFKATLNTSEMDAKIQALQQKLKQISSSSTVGDKAKSIYGEGSPMSDRAQKLQESANTRNLTMLREEFNLRDRLYKGQEANLKQINQLVERAKKGSTEELNLLKEKVSVEEKLIRLQNEQNVLAERAKAINKDLPGFKGVGSAPDNYSSDRLDPRAMGEVSGGGGGGGLISKLIGGMGVAAVTRALVQGIQGAANLGAQMYEYEQTKSGQQANMAQGAFKTSGAGNMITGQGVKSMFFAQERMKAMQNAESAQGAMNLRGFGDTLGSVAGGALRGAGAGAMIGSVVPGVGTAIGGLAGGAIGGLAGLGSSLMEGQTGAGIKGALSGENPMEAVSRYRAQKFFTDMQANQQAEEAKDPYKQIAFDYMEGNKDRFLKAQQISGMGDEQLTGPNGFLSSQYGSFTTDQKLGAMSGVAGAGGSSAQVRNANQALEMERSYGTQNATGIAAGLSKGIGGGIASSDEVMRRIMGDAFSVGLDSSKFGREAEKFLSISAKFVEESGARTVQDQQRIAAEMGSFVTGDSMKQIEASGEARGFLENKLGAGGGQYQKALQLSKMRTTEGLNKLSEAQKISLMNMTPDQVKAGGLEIETMMSKSGLDKKSFEKAVSGAKEFGMTQTGDQAQRLEKIKAGEKSTGINAFNLDQINSAIAAEKDPAKRKQLQELKDQAGEFISGETANLGLGGKSSQFKEAYGSGASKYGQERKVSGAAPEQDQGIYTQRQKAEATQDQQALQNAMEYSDIYAKSVESIAGSSATLAKALEIMSAAIKSGNADIIKQATYSSADIMAGGTGKNVKPSAPSGIRSAKDM